MKTKALALVAAVVAASTITSMAQVYSANAVGYVNLTLVPGFNIIANPLDNGDNDLNTILPNLPPEAIGSYVFRFDPTATPPNYAPAIGYVGIWVGAGVPGELVVEPGEGFFFQNNSGAPLDVTFVGDVMQGDLSRDIVANNALSIVASQVPQEARIGHAADLTGDASGLEFPAYNFDLLYQWDTTTGNYFPSIQYIEGAGWLGGDGDPNGPVIKVGEGFFVQKADPAPTRAWTRSFSVN